MSKLTIAALVAAASVLAACGGGSNSDFKAEVVKRCEKDGGKMNGTAVDCACSADVMDAELDSDTKKLLVAMARAEGIEDPAKQKEAMKEAGFDPDNPEEMMKLLEKMTALAPVETKVIEKCKK